MRKPGKIYIDGAKLRERRRAQKLSAEALGKPEFSGAYITAIERDRNHPPLRTIEILAQKVGIPLEEIIFRAG